jgi:signal transduction histidine kinase
VPLKTIIRVQKRELASLRRDLKREVVRREIAETSLKASKQHYVELLKRSNIAREQKLVLARTVLLAQEEERREISRALHDEVSQTLAGINIKLASLKLEAAAGGKSFKNKIAHTQRLVEKSVDIVHRFARRLRPTLLDDLGLIPALHSYMKILTKQPGLQIRFTAFPGVEKISNAKRTAFYRIAQSALTNVARHAKASLVHVTFKKAPGGIVLEVQDDGKSFDVEKILLSRRYNRLGLLSMRERVEMFGGTFDINSSPGKGTLVRATIPSERKKG